MTDATELPERGHNNPPEGILPILPPTEADEKARAEALARAKGALAEDEAPAFDLKTFSDLEASTLLFCDAAGEWKRIEKITTTTQSERLTDFVTGARGLFKKVDTARKDAKAPWDAGGKKVQDAFTPLLAKLEAVAKQMKLMQGDWLVREDARIAEEKRVAAEAAARQREAAERLAAQAAARDDISAAVDAEAALKEAEKAEKAAAKPTKARAGSATGGGRTMALRTQKVANISNFRACYAHFQNDPAVREVLQRLADAAARGGMSADRALMAGFTIEEKVTSA